MKGISKEQWGIARRMRFTAGRNQIGLTERQVAYCVEAWAVPCADQPIAFNTSEAIQLAFPIYAFGLCSCGFLVHPL